MKGWVPGRQTHPAATCCIYISKVICDGFCGPLTAGQSRFKQSYKKESKIFHPIGEIIYILEKLQSFAQRIIKNQGTQNNCKNHLEKQIYMKL